jgi:acetylornithine/succinyldiaminopimelate/putrescine aminotransferase
MKGLRALCDAHGCLLIVDEVQCGLGRTGRLWAHEAYPECRPDMMTLAKPLAGGLPIGAVMMSDDVAAAIAPGDHGTTFGGNPLVTRAASVVFSRINDPAFLAATRERGGQLVAGLKALAAAHPRLVKEVRAPRDGGLFVGVELAAPPKALVRAALDEGLVLITAGDSSLRICPPLVISADEVDFGLGVLRKLLPAVYPDLAGPAPPEAPPAGH